MPRTIVYPRDLDGERDPSGGGGPTRAAATPKTRAEGGTDGYLEKLVKYVPAEVVAFFAPIASLVENQRPLLIASGVVGLLATPAYLWAHAKRLDRRRRPPLYNYILSTLAFVVWALATSKLGAMFHITSTTMGFTLGVTVFVIPLADRLLSRD